MFTTTVVLSVLKGVFKNAINFFWQYKWVIILGMILGFLYARGNHYEDKYRNETVAHLNAVLQHRQDINDIRLANETALRTAKEKAFEDYKALVEKTSELQEKYDEREKDINTTVTKLNASNNSLQQAISNYTKRNTNSNSGETTDSSYAESLFVISGLLETCSTESIYYANEAAKLSNSVNTLQGWGNVVIDQSKQEGIIRNNGEKDE